MDRKIRQARSIPTTFRAAEESGEMYIEGYFAVFGSVYELWPGATESIAETAFNDTLSGDIRALIDHETRLVLGRNTVSTLELKIDSRGLWGRAKINQKDTDATNLYARVERGDVDQCSFGFDILEEDTEYRDNGSVHWTIKKVELFEVSVVTFPAYEDTGVAARKKDYDKIKNRQNEVWRTQMKVRLQKWR